MKIKPFIIPKEIGALLIASVGISLAFSAADTSMARQLFLFGLLFVAPAFVFHEMGHKAAAWFYNCDSEFEIFPLLILLSIIIAFSGLIIIFFGAVFFEKPRKNIEGKIALGGPAVNICLAILFLGLFFFSSDRWADVCYVGALVNSYMAAFNLLPIPPFDGYRVFRWRRLFWAAAFFPVAGIFLFLWKQLSRF